MNNKLINSIIDVICTTLTGLLVGIVVLIVGVVTQSIAAVAGVILAALGLLIKLIDHLTSTTSEEVHQIYIWTYKILENLRSFINILTDLRFNDKEPEEIISSWEEVRNSIKELIGIGEEKTKLKILDENMPDTEFRMGSITLDGDTKPVNYALPGTSTDFSHANYIVPATTEVSESAAAPLPVEELTEKLSSIESRLERIESGLEAKNIAQTLKDAFLAEVNARFDSLLKEARENAPDEASAQAITTAIENARKETCTKILHDNEQWSGVILDNHAKSVSQIIWHLEDIKEIMKKKALTFNQIYDMMVDRLEGEARAEGLI
jgi:hypothetical protein